MARKVENLDVFQQGGNDTTYTAIWEFKSEQAVNNGGPAGSPWLGMWVKIKPGSTYYNGTAIPVEVMNDDWNVIAQEGNRATLGQNRNNDQYLGTSINVKNIEMSYGISPNLINTLDHFEVYWQYDAGDGIWYEGQRVEVTDNQSTYNAPSNSIGVWVHVLPVAKTYKKNKQDAPYWNGDWVQTLRYVRDDRPKQPSVPTVTIKGYELTCSVENISDPQTDQVQFAVYNDEEKINSGTARVISRRASWTCTVAPGGRYRALCRSMNVIGTGATYSEWTDLSEAVLAVPSVPSKITKYRANSSTSVYLEWNKVDSAETYDIEYTTNVNYFDASSDTTTVSGIKLTHYEITGLTTGDEYFFRVRAVNKQGASGWSEIVSVSIGKDPAAPTTWSSSTTVITGQELNLYWVHNAEDGSKERYAEVEITVGEDKQTYTVKNPTGEDDEAEEKTKFYSVDTSKYSEGTQLKWRVRTAGVTLTYGDWSIMRTVDIYAPPTLALSVTNQNGDAIEQITGFPIYLKGLAGPNTQMPIGYYITITANTGYETIDRVGNDIRINAGDAVYTRYIDTNDPLLLELSAGNIDLQNGITYTITVIASMNSGLTIEASSELTVSWTDEAYDIDVSITVDKDNYVSYIAPYCNDEETGKPIPGISLSVYRREFDGTFKEIASGIDNTMNTTVTDPHPALDFARYRIVATIDATGAVSFYDPPAYPISCKEIVLQWDEKWVDFDTTDLGIRSEPVYTGSIIRLPYNIDVSDDVTPEAKLVKYIGRAYPVAYYGTQIESSSTWNTVIPKSDTETIYMLRRLSLWKGDVYVREPSGSGYWANITVSFSQKHTELTVPITFTITRVEGGA